MSAFDTIFDEAVIDAATVVQLPRQKAGRAKLGAETAEQLPAPTQIPASKRERPAAIPVKPENPSPVATTPATAGEPMVKECAKTKKPSPSAQTKPARKAGKTKAIEPTKPILRPPSSSPIPRKRGRPAISCAKPIKESPGANNRDGVLSKREEAQGRPAPVSPLCDRAGQDELATHRAVSGAVAILQAEWRMRQRWHKAEKALILQAKALLRGLTDGDKDAANVLYEDATKGDASIEATIALAPFLPAIARFEADRKQIEKTMQKRAKDVPAYGWATGIKGLGAGSFVSIVGEAGDIGSYKSVSALWKRMGLAVFDGGRQRKCSNADEALLHGYNPSRRSVMWNVGGALIGGMGRGPRPYPGEDISAREEWTYWQKLFVERCRYESARSPEKMPLKEAVNKKTGETLESYTLHAQARAKRYVEKRFLRKLYAQWRLETLGASGDPEDEIALPLAAE